MTNLEILQKEAREKFCDKSGDYIARNVSAIELDELITRVYLAAIEDAKKAMPEEEVHTTSCKAWHARPCTCQMIGFNDCRKETLTALEALIPNVKKV